MFSTCSFADKNTRPPTKHSAVIASCVRIAYVRAMLNNADVLYTQGSAAVWSAVEINIGILCNCLAILKPFVRRHMPWLKSLVGARSSDGYAVHLQHHHHHNNNRGTAAEPIGGGCGKMAAVAVGVGHHREKRRSSGIYELHSYGRDREFGDGVGGAVGGVVVERGGGTGRGSLSEGSLQEGAPSHGGILVTTVVAMGRSTEGDVSTDDILFGQHSGVYETASSLERNIGLALVPAARMTR